MYKSITLELSLKPFKKTNDEYIADVCRKLFRQWYSILKDRERISVMMWTADGSQVLDYAGSMEDTFDWACFIGNANNELGEINKDFETNIHAKKWYYMKNPPVMTYGILKSIVSAIKREAKELFPYAIVTVGETFDIGPEFAVSDFKYNRHREVCGSTSSGDPISGRFIDSTAHLFADTRRYAGFQTGIPEHTHIGYFLGRQASEYMKDLGFDYLWLSNGVGYSVNPWSQEGKIYDGVSFHADRLAKVKSEVTEFWRQFRMGCPDFEIRTRGTNNSVGIDYATDGVPLAEIYGSGLNIVPPPNSPWAALNDNVGLELMGHMTRICNLPENNEFMFRYYIHDPWWINSPWYDRYRESPHDIYLPMSIARINENGELQSAEMLSILTVDNSFGDMPDTCVNEPLPHLLKAERNVSDEPAPFVWVYPMKEYTTAEHEDELACMYYGDKFICDAINCGFPLNCVVSTDNFEKHTIDIYRRSVLVTPAQISVKDKLCDFAEKGVSIIVYGTRNEYEMWQDVKNAEFICIDDTADKMLEAADKFGYSIKHSRKADGIKVPTMTISRHNNGMYFSVYNSNTTTSTALKFPLGAPILMNCETELKDGYSTYNFGRWEHRECRVFVKQKSGLVAACENTTACIKYRRRIRLTGLKDAEVIYFSEEYSKDCPSVGPVLPNYDKTPVLDERFKTVYDPSYGTYIKGEHITGDICLFMPSKRDW